MQPRSLCAYHIGRPALATDASGAVTSQVSYTTFGAVHSAAGLDTGLRFPGQVYHWESALHQNWMRDYDPSTGRYIQADPLGLVDGASVYGYALQSPGRYVDPRGEQSGPPTNIPGGPWTPAGAGQRPGTFFGPKQSFGPRTTCTYVPANSVGTNPHAAYWKTQTPGQKGWQRYNLKGQPISAEQAHPGRKPRLPRSPISIPMIMIGDPSWFMPCENSCPRS